MKVMLEWQDFYTRKKDLKPGEKNKGFIATLEIEISINPFPGLQIIMPYAPKGKKELTEEAVFEVKDVLYLLEDKIVLLYVSAEDDWSDGLLKYYNWSIQD